MEKQRVDTTRLQRLARAYTESATLFAALDLEIFSHISQGADTFEKLADATKMLPLNVERLVSACLAMGLLDWDDGKLQNAPDAERFLVKGKNSYAEPWMNFTRPDVPEWFRLTEHLRRTDAPTTLGMYADLTVEDARAYHASTYSIGMGAGKRFSRLVDLSGRKRLLDLGGGSGAYSIQAVRAYPDLTAVVFDLPPVVEVTKDYLAACGVADRVSVRAGDFTSDGLPAGADVIVMASNLPIYDERVIQLVIGRAFDALEPGGEMHLIGEMIFNDRAGPLDAAMWGLAEALNHSGGKAHTIAQCIGYFESAGFTAIADEVFVDGTLHRVSGLRAS